MKTINKQHKIVLVPTDKETCIFKNGFGNTHFAIVKNNNLKFEGQFYYVLSDEEIKEGDWFVFNATGDKRDTTIIQLSKGDESSECIVFKLGKIIATNNPELTFTSDEIPTHLGQASFNIKYNKDGHYGGEDRKFNRIIKSLPTLSDDFLKQWIKNPIEEIEVEITHNLDKRLFGNKIGSSFGNKTLSLDDYNIPKINQDNTINCSFIEEYSSFYKAYEDFIKLENSRTAYEFLKYLEKNYNPPIKK